MMRNELAKIKKIAENPNIDAMGIFGSRARRDNRENSDYDIFMISNLNLEEELELEEKLEKVLNQTVDLIQLNEKTDKRLAKNIINDGIIIVDKKNKYMQFCIMIENFYRENSDFIEKRKRDLINE